MSPTPVVAAAASDSLGSLLVPVLLGLIAASAPIALAIGQLRRHRSPVESGSAWIVAEWRSMMVHDRAENRYYRSRCTCTHPPTDDQLAALREQIERELDSS